MSVDFVSRVQTAHLSETDVMLQGAKVLPFLGNAALKL